MIGTTISHYKILEKLGEGGMGVVYKAQDTKLNRIVALKFLPDRVNLDEAAKARFMQEAQAAAGLNHPNICTIYGVEEHDRSLFMVMEYIEGGTLRNKIPFASHDDAITIATQIAEALGEAHSKGIVHRDVKADNIMLTAKGQAKVLDFGLAKLKGSLKLTRTSSTVGTLGYMAPEQIQGGEVDHRSDIFSFGVLLFEMLTGKLPFRGEHEAAMVYSIVNEEPQDITQLVSDLSPIVVNLIQRCLEKNPEDRYQTIQDAVIELRRSQKKTSRVMRQVSAEHPVNPLPQPTQQAISSVAPTKLGFFSHRRNLYSVTAAGALIVAVTTFLLMHSSAPELNPDMTFRTIQMPFTVIDYPGLSSDGNWIVFPAADANGTWDIYWMHNSGGEARRVTFDSSAAPPVLRQLAASISPDGSQIAYGRFNGLNEMQICMVPSNGGIGRKIAVGVDPKWRPDGERIGFATIGNIYAFKSIKPDGSDERTEFIDSLSGRGNYDFAWSPDGNSIAWLRTFPDQSQEIIIRHLQSGREKQLTVDGKNIDDVCWTANNMIFFSSTKAGNTNLWCIPADGGKESQVTRGGGPDLGVVVSADYKKLLYYQNQDVGYIWRTNGLGTDSKQLTFDNQNIATLCFSLDGRYIVFSSSNDQGFTNYVSHLYVMDIDGSNRRQLTFGNEVDFRPAFSPDGKHIAFVSHGNLEPPDSDRVKLIDFPSSGEPRTIRSGIYPWWIDDANMIALDARNISSWKVSVAGGQGVQVFQDSTYALPIDNGRYIPYVDFHSAHRGIHVYDEASKTSRLFSPSATPLVVLSKAGFGYYVKPDRSIWKVYFRRGTQEKLQGTLPGIQNALSVAFSADGKSIAFIDTHSNGRLVMIDNLFK